jgi:uncharacterized protein YkwD
MHRCLFLPPLPAFRSRRWRQSAWGRPGTSAGLTVARRVAVALLVLAGAVGADQAEAQSRIDRDFLLLVNEARAAEGIEPLRFDRRAQRWAEAWTEQMVRAGELSHQDPRSFLFGRIVRVGENVGADSNGIAAVFAGFMASAPHRANVLDRNFTHVGIGSTRAPYRGVPAVWTTHLFIRVSGSERVHATWPER